jgi:hypothetical protein
VGAHLDRANLDSANLDRANLDSADLWGTHPAGADSDRVNRDSADLWGTRLAGADLRKVKSFYKAKLDPRILSEIKSSWPEKLATIWDYTKKDWVIDSSLLEQVKKTDWHGWPEGKPQGK